MRQRRRSTVANGLVALLLLLVFVRATVAEELKTLQRSYDPVVVQTTFAAALPRVSTASCRLYAARDGSLEPIPYQFDERDSRGRLRISQDGRLDFVPDANDEIVFMAKDTGDRVRSATLPGASAAFEIEVTDPLTGESGWAYLLAFVGEPPPVSPVRYVDFDPARNEVSSAFYTVTYDRRQNRLNGLRIYPAAGGNGKNFLHRTRMRGRPTFRLLLAEWSPEFTDESTTVRVDGIKVGPVRVIRRTRLAVHLGALFPELPRGNVDTEYYLSSFTMPTNVSVPALALKLLTRFTFETVSELRLPLGGMRYWDGANPGGIRLDQLAGADLRKAVDHDWWVLSGAAGTALHAFLIPEKWKQWGIVRGTVVRDAEITHGEKTRQTCSIGYSLLNMTAIREGGRHVIRRATVILPKPYEPGDEAAPMAMFENPLVVSIRAIDPPSGAALRAAPPQ